MRRTTGPLLSALRALTPVELLNTVRNDPGMTSEYYANRYFGKDNAMKVQACLWGELKRHGKVTMERTDGPNAAPRWHPVFGNPRPHRARRHNPLDEDLSVLKDVSEEPAQARGAAASRDFTEHTVAAPSTSEEQLAAASSVELEAHIVRAVQSEPGMDIQHYIHRLPAAMRRDAPAAFKRLREAGLLERRATAQGAFVWH